MVVDAASVAAAADGSARKQHCLYFFPLPQGHGSLRPGLALLMTGNDTAWG